MIHTPFGPVANLGTDEAPSLGGPAEAVGYVRGVLAAQDAVIAGVDHARCATQAANAIAALLK